MKKKREHLVPLSVQAVAILKRRRGNDRGDAWSVHFPGTRQGAEMSENTMLYACYRMGYRSRQTIHGFRALASTWANESQNYRSDWIELALAPVEDDAVRAAYNSAQHLNPRARMLRNGVTMLKTAASPRSIDRSLPALAWASVRKFSRRARVWEGDECI